MMLCFINRGKTREQITSLEIKELKWSRCILLHFVACGASWTHDHSKRPPFPRSTWSLLLARTPRTAVSTLTYWSSCLYAAKSPHGEQHGVKRTQSDRQITVIGTSRRMTCGMLADAACWVLFQVTFCYRDLSRAFVNKLLCSVLYIRIYYKLNIWKKLWWVFCMVAPFTLMHLKLFYDPTFQYSQTQAHDCQKTYYWVHLCVINLNN